jgi:chromate transporter
MEARLAVSGEPRSTLSLKQLFAVFFKAGCAFGGGLGVLGLLQEQLVTLRRILPDKELITLWSIGRIMPSGTMTAVAVAVGHRLGGFPGTVVALVAMILPGFICVVVLTIAYGWLAHGPVLDYIDATLLPAALGIIIVSAVRLGRPIFRLSRDLVFAVIACIFAALPNLNPAVVIILGGVAGTFLLRGKEAPDR